MAMKRYDVVAITGTYTDRNGNERKRYLNCGAVFETEKGLSLKLESLPVGFDGWFQLYEPRQEDAARTGAREAPRQGAPIHRDDEFEDDISF